MADAANAGRHRAWFTQHVLSAVGGSGLTWKDFNFTGTIGEASNHGDAETMGVNFLPAKHAASETWQTWWPQTGNVQNWDAVGVLERNGTGEWVLVEAKGNIEELCQSTTAKPKAQGGRLEQIQERLVETQRAVGVSGLHTWTAPYYQYANRLTLLHFLQERSIAACLLFVYFTGDFTRGRTCPASAAEWLPALDAMKQHLGLTGRSTLEQRVHEVFVPVGGLK